MLMTGLFIVKHIECIYNTVVVPYTVLCSTHAAKLKFGLNMFSCSSILYSYLNHARGRLANLLKNSATVMILVINAIVVV